MLRSTIPLALLALGSLSLAVGGLDPRGTRQTAGIHVSADGKICSVYFEFPASKHRGGSGRKLSVTLSTDLDLWIEGHRIPEGSHRWTLDLSPSGEWSLSRPAAKGRGEERYLFETWRTQAKSRWLTASFEPDLERRSVVLHLRYGENAGRLRLGLAKDAGTGTPDEGALDLVELRALRSRLSRVAGTIEKSRRHRHACSMFLTELGDALEAAPGGARLRDGSLVRDEQGVRFVVRIGALEGRTAAEELGTRLSGGELARIFKKVETPLVRLSPDAKRFHLEIAASSTTAEWDRVEPVPALSEGKDLADLARDVLLLEARIEKQVEHAVAGVADLQDFLLEAKRASGVLISAVVPGRTEKNEEGAGRFSVELTAAGPGTSLLRFVRALEDWNAPVDLLLLRVAEGDFGGEVLLRLTFHTYTPLRERATRLYASLRAAGMTKNFAAVRDVYLRGLEPAPAAAYEPPPWKRDPFAAPGERKE